MSRTHRHCGFTLIELLVVIAMMSVLMCLILSAAQRARGAAARVRCGANLREIGLALHGYHDTHRALPPGTNREPGQFPYLSWSARILPYLEHDAIWLQTVADFAREPQFWRPPRHRSESLVIRVFNCPSENLDKAFVSEDKAEIGFRHYLGVAGRDLGTRDGVLYLNSRVRMAEITDGTSHTLAVGERPPSADLRFGWWYAGTGQGLDGSADSHLGVRELCVTFRAPTCAGGPYHFQRGKHDDMCSTFHFWSNHADGANFLFVDGSVQFLTYSADRILPALATRAGGDAADWP